ncbi:MAG: hypothetical protein QW275_02580 [Candidatus Anstonellaceae archaeon]
MLFKVKYVLATPVRWLLMFLVAACGYFIITSSDSGIRAAAFVLSVVFWQTYCVVLMYEADKIRNSNSSSKPKEKPTNKNPL